MVLYKRAWDPVSYASALFTPTAPSKDKEAKKKRLAKTPPGTYLPTVGKYLLGGGAVLGGLGGLLRAGISSDEITRLDEFSDLAKKTYTSTPQGYTERLRDYVMKGHGASTVEPFGLLTAENVVRLIRSSHVPFTPSAWQPGSQFHYRGFMESPTEAYLQLLSEMPWSVMDADSHTSKYRDDFQEGNRAFLTPLRQAIMTYADEKKTDPNQIIPWEKDFSEWLGTHNSELAREVKFQEERAGKALERKNPVAGYSNLTRAVSTAWKWLPWVGGAAALGGVGALLWNHLNSPSTDAASEEARIAEADEAGDEAPDEPTRKKKKVRKSGATEKLEEIIKGGAAMYEVPLEAYPYPQGMPQIPPAPGIFNTAVRTGVKGISYLSDLGRAANLLWQLGNSGAKIAINTPTVRGYRREGAY